MCCTSMLGLMRGIGLRRPSRRLARDIRSWRLTCFEVRSTMSLGRPCIQRF